MRGNSQNGGQTTKSLLIKPQCSGVPIQQAVSLSSSFPRHCLLFVCAFFRKMQAGSWSEELPLPPVSCIQNRPGFHHGNRGDSFALGALFQALTQNLARGLLVSPAYAGKISCSAASRKASSRGWFNSFCNVCCAAALGTHKTMVGRFQSFRTYRRVGRRGRFRSRFQPALYLRRIRIG